MSAYPFRSKVSQIGLCAALGLLGCGDIAETMQYGDEPTRTRWNCVPKFERIVVKDALVMHVCPPVDENTTIDRWTGDAICDSRLVVDIDGGTSETSNPCEPEQVRVDVVGDGNLLGFVDVTVREKELVLSSNELLLPRGEYGESAPSKYKPIVVLVRHRIHDVVAQDYSQVVVDGASETGATALMVEAHDRAEVRLAGKAKNVKISVGERAIVDASGLLVETAELVALGDAINALDIGGRASAKICALRAFVLGEAAECNNTTLFDTLTRAIDVTACCTVTIDDDTNPSRGLSCGDTPLSECVGVPACELPGVTYRGCDATMSL